MGSMFGSSYQKFEYHGDQVLSMGLNAVIEHPRAPD